MVCIPDKEDINILVDIDLILSLRYSSSQANALEFALLLFRIPCGFEHKANGQTIVTISLEYFEDSV
jgi:hypothetical protein